MLFSRNCFGKVLSVIYLKDNLRLQQNEKTAKIRPFYNLIAKQYFDNRSSSVDLLVDESVLPYFGKNSIKHSKSVYPLWVQYVDSSGKVRYVVNFNLYQGEKNCTTRASDMRP